MLSFLFRNIWSNKYTIGMENKQCSKCKQCLPYDRFYRNKQWSDGLHPYCKTCHLAYQKAKRDIQRIQSPGEYRWKRDLIRHDYFSQIDTPIKAYVLGILAADGNILAKYSRITLELSAKDADLLELVRDELVPGGAITTRHRRDHDYNTLAFVSHPMVKDLEALCVTPAKSQTITWPDKLPPSFAREFILGYFDGDGSITYHERPNRRYPYIGITSGSFNLLAHIVDITEQHTGVRFGGPWSKKDTGNVYAIRASGDKALTIDGWLHASGLGLKRKCLENISYRET